MIKRIVSNIINVVLILLVGAAHYQDWGSDFMFELDIAEVKVSSVQARPTGATGISLLMKLGAFNSCLQVPKTVQETTPFPPQTPQEQLLKRAFSKELPQQPCQYGEGGFPPSLPIKPVPMEIQKVTNILFLTVSSSFIVIISLWSLKLIGSIVACFLRIGKIAVILDYISTFVLSGFVIAMLGIMLAVRKLVTRRTFYNHILIDVSLEPGGGLYLLILVLIIQALFSLGSKQSRRKSNKVVSIDSGLPPSAMADTPYL